MINLEDALHVHQCPLSPAQFRKFLEKLFLALYPDKTVEEYESDWEWQQSFTCYVRDRLGLVGDRRSADKMISRTLSNMRKNGQLSLRDRKKEQREKEKQAHQQRAKEQQDQERLRLRDREPDQPNGNLFDDFFESLCF
jgi:hypothetical protein